MDELIADAMKPGRSARTDLPQTIEVIDGAVDVIDRAFQVLSGAIKHRDAEIESLRVENGMLRINQTNKVYSEIASILFRRFETQLMDTETGDLRENLQRLMEQRPTM